MPMQTQDEIRKARRRQRICRLYVHAVKVMILVVLMLDAAVLFIHWGDSQHLTSLAQDLVDGTAAPSVQMRSVAGFVTELPEKGPDRYFMLPIFRPLRPTARQVIDYGGYCAYKARAFIVLLKKLDIHAHKLTLHDAAGEPRHVVAVVKTEKGHFIVDLLFGIIYEHDDGTPMTVEHLATHLETVIGEEIQRGNLKAGQYPVEDYPYTDISTINWKKNVFWGAAYGFLRQFMSEADIVNLRRPYFSEEPAHMVWILSGVFILWILIPMGMYRSIALIRGLARRRV